MKVSVAAHQGYQLVSVTGKITIGNGDIYLRETILKIIGEGHKKIVLDLSKVSYMDSSGLGELISIYQCVKHSLVDLCLVGLNPKIYSILALAQLVALFPIYDSVEDAAMIGFAPA